MPSAQVFLSIYFCQNYNKVKNKRVTSFAKRLKELRIEQKLSQKQLAEELGEIGASTIAEWELDKYSPSIEYAIKLADFFEVTVGYMVGMEE